MGNFNALSVFPGTELYDKGKQYGHIKQNTDEATFQHMNFVPYTMTMEELILLRRIAYKEFYGSFSYILKRILDIRSFDDVKAILKGGVSLLNIYLDRRTFDPINIKDF